MSKILVSIITVSYNSEHTIADTIESVLNQTYDNIEYIIIDGKSKDNTMKIVESYKEQFLSKNKKYIRVSEKDRGIYDAMNKGIKMASGSLIGIINSDDWYHSGAVNNVVNKFESSTCDLVVGKRNKYTYNKQYRKTIANKIPVNKYIESIMPVNHPSMFVSSQTYKNIGAYDISYKLSADYDFVYRCIRSNQLFGFIDSVVANMRDDGATAKNKNLYISAREDYLIRKKYRAKLAEVIYLKRILIIPILILLKYIRGISKL